jgi:hypothetical protein
MQGGSLFMSHCAFTDCSGDVKPNVSSPIVQRVTLFAVRPLVGDAFGGCLSLTDVNPMSLTASTFTRGSAVSSSADSSAAGGCVSIQAAAVSTARAVLIEGCNFTQCIARSIAKSSASTSVAMGGAVSLLFGCVTCDFIVTDFYLLQYNAQYLYYYYYCVIIILNRRGRFNSSSTTLNVTDVSVAFRGNRSAECAAASLILASIHASNDANARADATVARHWAALSQEACSLAAVCPSSSARFA